ncbi:MAG: hypothetical protein ABWJ99_07840 [Caldimicrobium sp.]
MNLAKAPKILTLFFAIFLFSACEPKEKLLNTLTNFKNTFTEKVKAKLSEIPFINRFIKLPPPPKELYEKTRAKIEELRISKAKDIYSKEYQELMKKWKEGESLYNKKYYHSAEKVLKEVLKEADSFLEMVKEYEINLKKRALSEYQSKEKELLSQVSPKEKEKYLKAKLYLWKLKNLLEMGEYEKFERELKSPPF